MNAFSLIGQMTVRKYAALTSHQAKPVRTSAPRGLHQGSAVELSQVPLILAQAAGAVFPEIGESQKVVSVGVFDIAGNRVFRSYLSDGRSFVQTVADKADPSKASETGVYTLHTEKMPGSPEDEAFLIGAPPRTARDPETGADVTVAEAVPALIGWPVFQLDDAKAGPLMFPRVWLEGDTPQEPFYAVETITDIAGGIVRAEHWMMLYGRSLGSGDTNEFLVADYIRTAEGAVFNASVGLAFDDTTLSVLAAA